MDNILHSRIFNPEMITKNALESKQDIFYSIFQLSPTNLIFINDQNKVITCNLRTCNYFGCESQENFVESFLELSPECQPCGTPSRQKHDEYLKLALEKGEIDFTFMHQKADGTPLPVKIKLVKLNYVDENGHQILIGFMNDISEFLAEQQAEHRFNERLNAILDVAPLSVNLWDENLNNVMSNAKALELFGLDNRQEYIDKFDSLSPEFQPNGMTSAEVCSENIRKAFETGQNKYNWLHQDVDGEQIPVEITLNKISITDEEGHDLVAGFTRDLRSSLAGNESNESFDEYFLDVISDKRLFNTVAELSDEWFFTLDVRTSMIQYFGKGRELFGLTADKENFPSKLLENGRVAKEDAEEFMSLVNNMKQGIVNPVDIKLVPLSGIQRYYRFVYRTVFDKKNRPIFCIGKASDVTETKALEIRSKTDLLTKCYNKLTSESMISDILNQANGGSHAIFIIDIDDFKSVNDNLGHHFGDMVLSEVAGNLRACFRNADVVGRIGGDEFIVFLKDVDDIKIIEEKAQKIANAFKNTYSGENNSYKISGSIGIARFPIDGQSYEDLYKAADKALYRSKLQGKDCYTFYTKELLEGTMKNRTVLENANRVANFYFDSELVSTVFNLLYEAADMKVALGAVMQFIGKRTNADRCYIFETFDEGKTYDNTYEWCEKGINPEIENLKGVTAEVLFDFFENADANGIFYSNDLRYLTAEGAFELMNEQGIKSFLHAQIKDKDYCKLFLGLDDCTRTRVWNEKEINSVLYAAKMISIFLLSNKKKIDEKK